MFFVFTLALALGLFQYMLALFRESAAARQQFEAYASSFHLTLSSAFHQYQVHPKMMANLVALLSSSGGSSSSSSSVRYADGGHNAISNAQFQQFSSPATSFWSFEIVSHIEWIPNVKGSAGRAAVEAQLKSQLNRTDAGLFVFNATGKTPTATASYYYPILLVAPCCSHDYIVGFNLAPDPIEGQYIDTARRTGNAVTSAPFILRGEEFANSPRPKGMTVYFPVHFNSTLNISVSFGGGGDRFLGVVTPVFVIYDLMHHTLMDRLKNLPDLYVFLYDVTVGSSPDQAIYAGHINSPNSAIQPPLELKIDRALAIAGSAGFFANDPQYEFMLHDRRFRVVTVASAAYGNSFRTFLPWAMLLIALLSRFVLNYCQAFRRSHFFARMMDYACPLPPVDPNDEFAASFRPPSRQKQLMTATSTAASANIFSASPSPEVATTTTSA